MLVLNTRHLSKPEVATWLDEMASVFSGALQLTDLDDFINPSQVGIAHISIAASFAV